MDGELYSVDRNWFRPFSMERLYGEKLVFRLPDDDHYDPRLSVVNKNESDEDDLSEYIANFIEQIEEEEAEEYMTDSDTVNSSGDNSGNDTGTYTPPFLYCCSLCVALRRIFFLIDVFNLFFRR